MLSAIGKAFMTAAECNCSQCRLNRMPDETFPREGEGNDEDDES